MRRRDSVIEVENEQLRIRIQLIRPRLDLIASRVGVGLQGFSPRVHLGGRALPAQAPRLEDQSEIEGPLGLTTRVRLRYSTAIPLDLILDVEIGEGWPGFVLAAQLENRGSAPLSPERIEPLHWSGDAIELPGPMPEWRFFRMGYQSWSPAGFPHIRDPDPRPRLPLARRIHFGPYTPLPRRGLHVSDFMTRIGAAERAGLVLGFLTHQRYLNYITLQHRGDEPQSLAAHVCTEGLPLAAGESLQAERLWVGVDSADRDGIADWAERSAKEMAARTPRDVGSGWCSWYRYFTDVTAENVRNDLRALSELDAPLDTVQIDDGYQAAIGDWLEKGDGFPDGLMPLAREIHSSGRRAGLWLAPYLVARNSRLIREHPEWLLRDIRGKARLAILNPAWRGTLAYALDPTHPEVQSWLTDLAASVRRMGFDYLKLDFLYAGALPGLRHRVSEPAAAAYRSGIEAFRRGALEDAYLLGCGAPLGPSIGLFEGMRIGPDVAPHWSAPVMDRVLGVRAAPAASNSIRNVLSRSSLHRKLWLNDADCVLLRERNSRLSPRQVQCLASVIALSGSPVLVSDELAELSDERRRWLSELLPAVGRAPTRGNLHGEIPYELWLRLADGCVWVLLVNLTRRRHRVTLELSRYGLSGAVWVYDIWAGEDRGIERGSLSLPAIPPHACLLLRLCPADGTPRVVGSSLHLAAGALETHKLRPAPGGGAELELRLPGRRSGGLIVSPDGRIPVPFRVRFEDALDLIVRGDAGGVEEPRRIPDR